MFRFVTTMALAGAMALPVLANAQDFVPVREKADFVALLQGRELRIGLYDLTLQVLPDGRILGDALGWEVVGNWSWQDGYFCREMDWSGYPIDYNCQLVEVRGGDEVRFTVDKGEGNSAKFRLR